MSDIDFSDYKMAALHAKAINEGFIAYLNGQSKDENPYMDSAGCSAWAHGWEQGNKPSGRGENRG